LMGVLAVLGTLYQLLRSTYEAHLCSRTEPNVLDLDLVMWWEPSKLQSMLWGAHSSLPRFCQGFASILIRT
jgi:hypothetical protein